MNRELKLQLATAEAKHLLEVQKIIEANEERDHQYLVADLATKILPLILDQLPRPDAAATEQVQADTSMFDERLNMLAEAQVKSATRKQLEDLEATLRQVIDIARRELLSTVNKQSNEIQQLLQLNQQLQRKVDSKEKSIQELHQEGLEQEEFTGEL